jgi:hypothetical protein
MLMNRNGKKRSFLSSISSLLMVLVNLSTTIPANGIKKVVMKIMLKNFHDRLGLKLKVRGIQMSTPPKI